MRTSFVCLGVLAVVLPACSGEGDAPVGVGAPDGSGGDGASGGSGGKGGSGTGLRPGSGGRGGTSSSGGTGGSGGSSASAGRGGTGGSSTGGMGQAGMGNVVCGGMTCPQGQVCCSDPLPCADMCVPDCRMGGGMCPDNLTCSDESGVCEPAGMGMGGMPANGGMGQMGGMPASGGMGQMGGMPPGGSGPMGGMAGMPASGGMGMSGGGKGGMAGMGSSGMGSSGMGSGGMGKGGSGMMGKAGTGPAPSDCTNLGSVNTPGPNPPQTDTATANFNVDPNHCTVTQKALECDADVLQIHQYSETISNNKRVLSSNDVPDHEVGDFPVPNQNPHSIKPQYLAYQVPLTPSGAGEDIQVVFGLATSGVVFEPSTAETYSDSTWYYEALRYADASPYFNSDTSMHPGSLGLDCNFAHVQSAGKYHYHGVPTAMLPSSPALTFLGWAGDGFPIFGRWGPSDVNDAGSAVVEMAPSYRIIGGGSQARPNGAPPGNYDGTFVQDWEYVQGLGDLDECNGRTGQVTVRGSTSVTYHYFVTHAFPYIPRCFKNTPDPSFDRRMAPPGG
jgi:hypothetical protein